MGWRLDLKLCICKIVFIHIFIMNWQNLYRRILTQRFTPNEHSSAWRNCLSDPVHSRNIHNGVEKKYLHIKISQYLIKWYCFILTMMLAVIGNVKYKIPKDKLYLFLHRALYLIYTVTVFLKKDFWKEIKKKKNNKKKPTTSIAICDLQYPSMLYGCMSYHQHPPGYCIARFLPTHSPQCI